MADQVPERSKDVPSYGDQGPNLVCVVVGREATNEELGYYRVVIQANVKQPNGDFDNTVEVVKDNTGGVAVHLAEEDE